MIATKYLPDLISKFLADRDIVTTEELLRDMSTFDLQEYVSSIISLLPEHSFYADQVVDILLEKDVNILAAEHNDLVKIGLEWPDLELLKKFTLLGLDVKANNNSAIVAASRQNRRNHCLFLLDQGVDANANNGKPLKYAMENNSDTIIYDLLKHGAVPPKDLDERHYKKAYGGPVQAIKDLTPDVNDTTIERLVERHLKFSKKEATELMICAKDWLKPHYLNVISKGL